MRSFSLFLLLLVGCNSSQTAETDRPAEAQQPVQANSVATKASQPSPKPRQPIDKQAALQQFVKDYLKAQQKRMGVRRVVIQEGYAKGVSTTWIPDDAGVQLDYSDGDFARFKFEMAATIQLEGVGRTPESRSWTDWLTVYFANGRWTQNDPSKSAFRLNE